MTDVDTVRLLISDLGTGDAEIYTDAQIQSFLDLEAGVVKLAAASALDALASNEAMVSKKIRTLDLQTDGPAVATALRASAAELRRQVYEDDGDGGYQVTTGLGTPHFGWPATAELAEHLYPGYCP